MGDQHMPHVNRPSRSLSESFIIPFFDPIIMCIYILYI